VRDNCAARLSVARHILIRRQNQNDLLRTLVAATVPATLVGLFCGRREDYDLLVLSRHSRQLNIHDELSSMGRYEAKQKEIF
jgi:hypothetical protein